MLTSYPKVYSLGHRYIAQIMEGDVTVEEKIDGSQISFGRDADGALTARSKGQQLFFTGVTGMFTLGLEQIYARKDLLPLGVTYRGEYLQKPKHNTIAYSRIPKDHIIIYDIEDAYGNPVSRAQKEDMAHDIGFEVVPGFVTPGWSKGSFEALLKTTSILGGETIEGVVIKNYMQCTDDKKYMVGKYVNDIFKERHGKEWKVGNPSGKDFIQRIGDDLKTDARYQKAKQALINAGTCTHSPADIGDFLKMLHADIDAEDADDIAAALTAHFLPQIKRHVCRGAAEWYKQSVRVEVFPEGTVDDTLITNKQKESGQ